MDYEERYKRALRKALDLYNQGLINPPLEHIFPQLKESEEERIRKELIEQIAYIIPNDDEVDNEGNALPSYQERINKYRAWVEKQKDYIKLPNSAYTSNKDVIEFANKYSHAVWENLMDKFKKNENYSIGCNDVSDIVLNAIINTYNWLETQGENKPTENIEIKFCEGDKVVSNQNGKVYTVGTAYHITGDNIRLDGIDGNYKWTNRDDLDKNYHLWSLEDAKDGDVLTNGESIVIFKQIVEPKYRQNIEAYIGLDWGFNIQVTSESWSLGIDKTMPATKEQRDLLFKKMKEAGYKWDNEKKELKQIGINTLDADKVIEWLNDQACLGWIEDVEVDKFVEKFKKDFGL